MISQSAIQEIQRIQEMQETDLALRHVRHSGLLDKCRTAAGQEIMGMLLDELTNLYGELLPEAQKAILNNQLLGQWLRNQGIDCGVDMSGTVSDRCAKFVNDLIDIKNQGISANASHDLTIVCRKIRGFVNNLDDGTRPMVQICDAATDVYEDKDLVLSNKRDDSIYNVKIEDGAIFSEQGVFYGPANEQNYMRAVHDSQMQYQPAKEANSNALDETEKLREDLDGLADFVEEIFERSVNMINERFN